MREQEIEIGEKIVRGLEVAVAYARGQGDVFPRF